MTDYDSVNVALTNLVGTSEEYYNSIGLKSVVEKIKAKKYIITIHACQTDLYHQLHHRATTEMRLVTM